MTFPFTVDAFKPISTDAISKLAKSDSSDSGPSDETLAAADARMHDALSLVREQVLFNQRIMDDALTENRADVQATIEEAKRSLKFDDAADVLIANLRELAKADEFLTLPHAEQVQADIIAWATNNGMALEEYIDEWISLVSLSDSLAVMWRAEIELIETESSNAIVKDLLRIVDGIETVTNRARVFKYSGYADSINAIADGTSTAEIEGVTKDYNRQVEDLRRQVGLARSQTRQADLLLESRAFLELRDVGSQKLQDELNILTQRANRCKAVLKILHEDHFINTDLDAALKHLRLIFEASASESRLATGLSKYLGEKVEHEEVGTLLSDSAEPALKNSARMTTLVDELFPLSVERWLTWIQDPQSQNVGDAQLHTLYEETSRIYLAARKGLFELSEENKALLAQAGEMNHYNEVITFVQASEESRKPKQDTLEKMLEILAGSRLQNSADAGALHETSAAEAIPTDNPFESSTFENYRFGGKIFDLADEAQRDDIRLGLVQLFEEMDASATSNISLRGEMIEREKRIYGEILTELFNAPDGTMPGSASLRTTSDERKKIFTTDWAHSMLAWERQNELVDVTRRTLGDTYAESFLSKRKDCLEKSKVVAATQRAIAMADGFIDEDPRRPKTVFFQSTLANCRDAVNKAQPRHGEDQLHEGILLQRRVYMAEATLLLGMLDAMANGWPVPLTDVEADNFSDLRKRLVPRLTDPEEAWLGNITRARIGELVDHEDTLGLAHQVTLQ
ncbi:hypothetical protein ACK9YZ_31445 [Rhizobium sp. ZK1]|uniref:hypothetical protein n=1 Tax=Rhizobium sp. ZK1 TaxID=3389872 RepID=UPI0039F6E261